MKKHVLAALTFAVAGSAFAADVGEISSAANGGLVAIPGAKASVDAAQGMKLPENAVVTAGTKGNLVVKLNSGCTVTLGPSQSFTVSEAECKAYLAAGGNPQVMSISTAGYVALGVAGLFAINELTKSDKKVAAAPTPAPAPPAPAPVPAPAPAPKPAPKPISKS